MEKCTPEEVEVLTVPVEISREVIVEAVRAAYVAFWQYLPTRVVDIVLLNIKVISFGISDQKIFDISPYKPTCDPLGLGHFIDQGPSFEQTW